MAIDQQRLDRLDAGTTILPQADDQVESPLSIPDLGLLFSNQADPNRPTNIPRREADAGRVLLEQFLIGLLA